MGPWRKTVSSTTTVQTQRRGSEGTGSCMRRRTRTGAETSLGLREQGHKIQWPPWTIASNFPGPEPPDVRESLEVRPLLGPPCLSQCRPQEEKTLH